MHLFRRLPLRVILIVPIVGIATLLLIVILWQLTFIHWPQAQMAEAYRHANQMADLLFEASAEHASERGFTAAYLSLLVAGHADSNLREQVWTARIRGDAALAQAFTLGERLVAGTWAPEHLRDYLTRGQQAWQSVEQARLRVDRSTPTHAAINTNYWLLTSTSLIEAAGLIRNTPLQPNTLLENTAFRNAQLQQAVWLAAEYAGRERAVLVAFIAGQRPLPVETRQELLSLRGIVDHELAYLRQVVPPLLRDNSALEAGWTQLLEEFVLRFGAVRAQIYATTQGNYPINEQQWLEHATIGINSLLAFSQIIGTSAAADAAGANATAQRHYQISIAMLIGVLAITGALLLLLQRAYQPLRHAALRIQDAERNNDLSLRLDATGGDELATLGRAYNTLLGRLGRVIQAACDAAVEGGSASQQIATTALQIEQRSHQQLKLLAHLATALMQIDALGREFFQHTAETASAAQRNEDDALGGLQHLGNVLEGTRLLAVQRDKATLALHLLRVDCREIARQVEILAESAQAPDAPDLPRRTPDVAPYQSLRDLIERIQPQALQVATTLATSQREAGSGVEYLRHACAAFERIAVEAGTFRQINQQIVAIADEPLGVINTMHGTLEALARNVEDNTRAVKQALKVAADINDQMQQLQALADKFQLPPS